MRIASVSASFLPTVTGDGVSVVKTAEALALEGHDVVLFGRRPAGDTDPHDFYGVSRDFEIVRFAGPEIRGVSGPLHGSRVAAEVRRRGAFDLVFGVDANALALVRADAPLVFEAHAPPDGRLAAARENLLFRRKRFHGVMAHSAQIAEDYRRRHPDLGRDRIALLYNGSEGAPSHGVPPATWPGRPDRLQVGYAGAIDAQRGTGVVAEVARRLPGVDVHVFGYPVRASEMPRLRNLYMHGFVRPAEIGPRLAALDCYVVPRQERVVFVRSADWGQWLLPMKIFDAMAYGLAICASDLPVVREVLTHDQTALLVPPDDVGAWTRAVEELAGNTAKRRRLGDAARAAFEERFTWRHRARRLVEFASSAELLP
jgi:glycosyltransferase involved in cell wall biosynthesis